MSSGLTPEEREDLMAARVWGIHHSGYKWSVRSLVAIIDRLLSGATEPDGGRDAALEEAAALLDRCWGLNARQQANEIRALKSPPKGEA